MRLDTKCTVCGKARGGRGRSHSHERCSEMLREVMVGHNERKGNRKFNPYTEGWIDYIVQRYGGNEIHPHDDY